MVEHSVVNSTDAITGSFVKYDCTRGYWFPDKTFSKVIHCNNASEWDGDKLENCTGITMVT